ncbi:MAG: hypothetical protein PHS46_04510 [Candidatus Omnitrophica bacterium]|nr:hypothetical protein [Candidatus Omnitrophota bacterium]
MRIFSIVLCLALMTGCAQSLKQQSNMLNAMNETLTHINYNKTYIFTTFGYPDSETSSSENGVCTETWTYKTNMGDKFLLLNLKPQKTRYMKITFRNNIVTDVIFQ